MDEAKLDEYERRITPIREAYYAEQLRIETEAENRRRALVKGSRGYSGRYWALGPALDAMQTQAAVSAIAAQLEKTVSELRDRYQEVSARIRTEIGL